MNFMETYEIFLLVKLCIDSINNTWENFSRIEILFVRVAGQKPPGETQHLHLIYSICI